MDGAGRFAEDRPSKVNLEAFGTMSGPTEGGLPLRAAMFVPGNDA
jgi:hypothetical protein